MSAPPLEISSLNPYLVYSCSPVATGMLVDLATLARPSMSSARTGSSNHPTWLVLELLCHVDGLLGIVAVVGVDVDGDVVADRAPDGFQALDVFSLRLSEVLAPP